MSLSDAAIAALADHEAVALGLPRQIEAWVTLRLAGRIDSAGFAIDLQVEPLKYAGPFATFRREGALLHAGERSWRLTLPQLRAFEAFDSMRAAGDSVTARLAAWPALFAVLHSTAGGYVRVQGHLPRVLLQHVPELPPRSLTRHDGRLRPVATVPHARWAMLAGHRYYLRAA